MVRHIPLLMLLTLVLLLGASSALSVERGRRAATSRSGSTVGSTTSTVRSPTVRLNNGCELPLLGLGTWKAEPDQVRQAVKQAIQAGYRMIDCAHIYGNEAEIGEALQECFQEGICQREDLFITSKLWNDSHGGEADVGGALQHTLDQLQLDYLDMYLIHWPVPLHLGSNFDTGLKFHTLDERPLTTTWKSMEACVKAGKTKGIGVSNWSIPKLKLVLDNCSIPPAINQVERHPYHQQPALLQFCEESDIHVTCYSPLGSMDRADDFKAADEPQILETPTIVDIARKRGTTPAQVVLQWAMQQGTSAIPKSVNPGRMAENLAAAVQQQPLSPEEMEAMNALNADYRFVKGDFFTEAPGCPHTMQSLWDDE